jgi:hypothetical protein
LDKTFGNAIMLLCFFPSKKTFSQKALPNLVEKRK